LETDSKISPLSERMDGVKHFTDNVVGEIEANIRKMSDDFFSQFQKLEAKHMIDSKLNDYYQQTV
jgi:hypothetical protein